MSFLTLSDLKSQTFTKATMLNESIRKAAISGKKVFLSYRRKDKGHVVPVVHVLQSLGINVYIDYLDDNLPDTPNSATAAILRGKIKGAQKFILMATPNSGDSKWIPWELGLGDGFIKYENVAILPVTNYSSTWSEQEYYSIYAYIEKRASQDGTLTDWAIIFPDNNAMWLKDWLNS